MAVIRRKGVNKQVEYFLWKSGVHIKSLWWLRVENHRGMMGAIVFKLNGGYLGHWMAQKVPGL